MTIKNKILEYIAKKHDLIIIRKPFVNKLWKQLDNNKDKISGYVLRERNHGDEQLFIGVWDKRTKTIRKLDNCIVGSFLR